MKEHDLLWAMLPEGLESFFDVESFQKNDTSFCIVLVEKNIIPSDLPDEYRGKKVINTVLKPATIDFFPIMGRKAEIIVKRRWWKFEGINKMLKRSIELNAEGTNLEKEFAAFLKELGRI